MVVRQRGPEFPSVRSPGQCEQRRKTVALLLPRPGQSDGRIADTGRLVQRSTRLDSSRVLQNRVHQRTVVGGSNGHFFLKEPRRLANADDFPTHPQRNPPRTVVIDLLPIANGLQVEIHRHSSSGNRRPGQLKVSSHPEERNPRNRRPHDVHFTTLKVGLVHQRRRRCREVEIGDKNGPPALGMTTAQNPSGSATDVRRPNQFLTGAHSMAGWSFPSSLDLCAPRLRTLGQGGLPDAGNSTGPKRGSQPAPQDSDQFVKNDSCLQTIARAPGDQLQHRDGVCRLPIEDLRGLSLKSQGRRQFSGAHPNDAGVHSGRVGLENFSRLRGQARQFPVGKPSETERPSDTICRQPGLPQDFGGLSPGQSAQPEHLGQTILGVRQPQGQPGVSVRQGLNVGDTPSVAQHRNRRRESSDLDSSGLRGKSALSALDRAGRLSAQPDQAPQSGQDRNSLPGVQAAKPTEPLAPSVARDASAVPPLPGHRIPRSGSVAPRLGVGCSNRPIIGDRLGDR